MDNEFYAGTSGLLTPIPKRDFPVSFQDKSRLTYYASLFNSIEINSSFYKIPLAKTVAKWADSVADNFRFTFKLWQGITHNKGLAFDPESITKFMNAINSVGTKKGCLLIQFPPSLTVGVAHQLRHLLAEVILNDASREWKIAVEFRNKSWYADTVYELLESFNACLVTHDLPASATPLLEPAVDFAYLRFHGPNGGYKGSYQEDVLFEYAQYVKEWMDDKKTVYAYFNNTAGNALANLQTLMDYANIE